jgi:hypothetical protein
LGSRPQEALIAVDIIHKMRNNTKKDLAMAEGTSKRARPSDYILFLSLAYGIGGVGKGLYPSHTTLISIPNI